MVYKRYIKKDGKTYGPYYYSSERRDGKVVSNYVKKAKKVDKKKVFVWVFAFLFLVIIGFAIFNLPSLILTGNVISDISFGEGSTSGTVSQDWIYVNLSSSSDESEHYSFVDFANDVVLWLTMDSINNSLGNLNSRIYDDSSYDNDGYAKGDAVQTAYGKWDKAYEFDGTGDYILVEDDNSLDLGSAGSFSAWVNASSLGTENVILDNMWGYDFSGYQLLYRSADTSFDFTVSDGSTFKSMVNTGSVSMDTTPITNTWYHVVGVSTGANGYLRLYVNGELDGEWNIDFTPSLDMDNDLRIGCNIVDGAEWNGRIDDVIIFNRSLADREVKALYNSSAYNYYHNFTGLDVGVYNYTSYAVDDNDVDSSFRSVTLESATEANVSYNDTEYDVELTNETAVSDGGSVDVGEEIIVKKDSVPAIKLTTSGDVDLSELIVNISDGKIAVNKSGVTGIETNKSLYLNNTQSIGAYICPDASSVEEVNTSCVGKISFTYSQLVSGTTKSGVYGVLQADGYYRFDNLSGSGGGEANPTDISGCTNMDTSGEWYNLTQDITGISGTCMEVTAHNVTLNCNGFDIVGDGTGYGINATNSTGPGFNFTIRNCNISGFEVDVDASSLWDREVPGDNNKGGYVWIINSTINYTRSNGGGTITADTGGDGGFFSIVTSIINYVDINGGDNSGDGDGPGSGGEVYVYDSEIIEINSLFGDAMGSGIYSGNGGEVIINNSNVTTINNYGGPGVNVNAGSGGQVVVVNNSNVTTINNYGGSIDPGFDVMDGGDGGNVNLSDSFIQTLDSHGGDGGFTDYGMANYGGDGGNLTSFNSSFDSINLSGGSAHGIGGDAGSIILRVTEELNISNVYFELVIGQNTTTSYGGEPGQPGQLTINYTTGFEDTGATYAGEFKLKIVNASSGVIDYGSNTITGASITSLADNVVIGDNLVEVDSSVESELNQSADITLYNTPNSEGVRILRDGVDVCNSTTTPACVNSTPLNAETVEFSVDYWTNYTIDGEAEVDNPPTWDTIPANESVVYGVAWGGVDFDASDDVELGTYFVNDTNNFVINSTGYLNWTGQLAVEEYYVNVSVNDSSGNVNSTIYNLNVTKADGELGLTFDKESPQDYGNSITPTCSIVSGEGSAVLRLNDSIITSGAAQDLAAGSWNFSCSMAATQNYTAGLNESNFVISKIAPTLNLDAVNVTYPSDLNILANETNSGDSDVTYNLYINDSLETSGSSIDLDKDLSAGVWKLTYNTTGGVNYSSTSTTIYREIEKATPTGTITGTTPITYGTSGDVEGSESNTGDGDVSYKLYRDGVEVSNPDTSVLAAGSYDYVYNTTGGENYSGSASLDTFTLVVNQFETALGISGTTPITYGTTTDVAGSGCPAQLTCSLNQSNGIYPAGVQVFNYSTDGNTNYTANWTTIAITINQDSSACDVLFNISSPQTWNTKFKVYTNCDTDFTLYRNGTEISNNSEQDLAAGSYNFTVIRTDDVNYSNTNDEEVFVINQASNTATLSITPSTSETYGTETTASCSVDYGTAQLFRDDVEVSNPETTTLAAGSYDYVCNVTANVNYTTATDSDTLVIGQETGEVYTYLDNSRANTTIVKNNAIWLNSTLNVGTGDVKLYINETLNSTASEIGVYHNFTSSGLYNITSIYDGNTNYTADTETWWVNVTDTDTTSPVIVLHSPSAGYSTTGTSIDFQFNVSDSSDIANCTLYLNGVGYDNTSAISKSSTNTIARTGLSVASYTWYVNCTDVEGNEGKSSERALTISVGLYCGDGSCNNGETCSTCSADCGECGGGGGGGTSCSDEEGCGSDNLDETRCVDDNTGFETCTKPDCYEWITTNCDEGFTCIDGECVEDEGEIVFEGDCVIHLEDGWNFISICVQQNDYSFSSVLGDAYDNVRVIYEWKDDLNEKEYKVWSKAGTQEFTKFNPERSYFVLYRGSSIDVELEGDVYNDVDVEGLPRGWNAPFYPYELVSEAIKNGDNKFYSYPFKYIYTWDRANRKFNIFSFVGTQEINDLNPGEGYFIFGNLYENEKGTLKYNAPDREE